MRHTTTSSLFLSTLLAGSLVVLPASCGGTEKEGEEEGEASPPAPQSVVQRASEVAPSTAVRYDPAIHRVESVAVGTHRDYEGSLARSGGDLWMAWLDYKVGVGDSLLVARLLEDRTRQDTVRAPAAGWLAQPRLTEGVGGRLLLSWESRATGSDDNWDVHGWVVGSPPESAFAVSVGASVDAAHDVAADGEGGFWFAWRTAGSGRFSIATRHVSWDGDELGLGALEVFEDVGSGAWDPRVAVSRGGVVGVSFEVYVGASFDVALRLRQSGTWGPVRWLASGPRLQYHPRILALSEGGFLCAWEEGAEGWGKPFSARKQKITGGGRPSVNDLSFARGPLHRVRRLRFARVGSGGELHALAEPLPMPSFRPLAAAARDKGMRGVGGFYERVELALDGRGRPWCVWRHSAIPGFGAAPYLPHHVFVEGWRVYARVWTNAGWSPMQTFDVAQRDGEQSLSIAPAEEGLDILWSVGRRDRFRGAAGSDDARDPKDELRFASVREPLGGQRAMPLGEALSVAAPEPVTVPSTAPVELGGKRFDLVFGDLHRHTDVSLCNAFLDGTPGDTYRYAIEATRLDFLAITDHTWDIDSGRGTGLTWWRGTKAVTRHSLPGRFSPFHGFERSSKNTDHNFITLRDDLTFHHRSSDGEPERRRIEEIWPDLDERTFTLPHQPVRGGLWAVHDEEKRPLMEVYQGFRTQDVLGDAHEGLSHGYRFGFIASSDHLSTSASFACAWSEGTSREAIFDALRSRRTFAATVPLRLVFRADEAWMGERVEASPDRFYVDVEGTAPIAEVRLMLDGVPWRTLTATDGGASFAADFAAPESLTPGEHYLYVQVLQEGGGSAWSSPIWFPATE